MSVFHYYRNTEQLSFCFLPFFFLKWPFTFFWRFYNVDSFTACITFGYFLVIWSVHAPVKIQLHTMYMDIFDTLVRLVVYLRTSEHWLVFLLPLFFLYFFFLACLLDCTNDVRVNLLKMRAAEQSPMVEEALCYNNHCISYKNSSHSHCKSCFVHILVMFSSSFVF